MLKVYNTLTKQKEEFKPLREGEVKMYVCGPTVYDYPHLGHARTYIAFDVIRRYLEHKGYTVLMVMNFTDIDDKIIKRARETGEDPKELAERFIKIFLEDMEALKVKPADIYPRVTDHIDDIIEFIGKLKEKGYAYEGSDGIYFEVKKFPEYGKLSGVKIEDLQKGARVEPGEGKKNPEDFALWKKAKPGEPKWDSPWGEGRPGWHIECSVMSSKYLGESFDIHGGGNDLIFPHHENEIAQSEACFGHEWVKYWLHTGFVMVKGEKMSKSLGNFVTIRELLKRYEPEVIRFFVLQKHYRSPLEYTEEGLQHAKNNLQRLYNTLENIRVALRNAEISYTWGELEFKTYEIIREGKRKFYEAMDDDFNTAEALKAVFEVANAINKYLTEANKPKESILRKALEFFKIVSEVFGVFEDYFREETKEREESEKLIELLVEVRKQLRKEKRYELADMIREELKKLGIQLEDRGSETTWKRIIT
ncbi:cysteine--tRNA ligase [Pyrococcus furiosus DSM 3638]|uniref:Cysteine--tRNA ligase n=3 Tax=Pyrococcus furiosus TaxID=2261 RepID=SYC_PYRFU|nr:MULTISPECIES: cysteine--tRNA ligase [Pyrococcus]Q8U227.2 RecName: Full=Cysteine--tRNA ligase; AltName: Full=Cysteinyl-tRNA synthetase; Short=CysRS [Pyrococcus furiosus DSM 3638]AFN03820.1 cysteinyl-tRNA ligase [Pyrococcus furiosus COM1]MDK2868851.1 cysteinyl-tRNA synthetase [Pyrococcus sp.]QEK78687.1 cysteine--tRNA ligase [Pyrococcus furiosus DSM 3638]